MSDVRPASRSRSTTVLLGALAAILVMSVIAFPDRAFTSSLQGLTVWWKVVFPALLPFLILSETLIGFGVVHALGVLLEPLMRILFRIPGAGGWVLALGGTIGLPSGARATATLCKQGLLTRYEAERLLALSHLNSPVFIVTIVGVGFLHNARLGVALAIVHFAAAIAVGVTQRLRSKQDRSEEPAAFAPSAHETEDITPYWRRALDAMHNAHTKDGRAFGKLLGDSVAASVQTVMMIGGYMIIFSVIVQIIDITQIVSLLQNLASLALSSGDVHGMLKSSITAMLEIHLGSFSLSEQSGLTGTPLAAAVAAGLGWGGLCSHAQAQSLVHEAELRYSAFLKARLLHAVYSYVLTFAAWQPLNIWLGLGNTQPTFTSGAVRSGWSTPAYPLPLSTLVQLLLLVTVMLTISQLLSFLRSKRVS